MTLRVTILSALLVAFAALLAIAQGQNNQLPQESFVVSVTADFAHNATGVPRCTECDCTHISCNWRYNFTCATRLSEGADDAEQRWGNCSSGCTCFPQSGVGFQGVRGITLVSNPDNNEPTRIGKITHYNNVISSGASPTNLRLTLYVSAPEFVKDFIIAYPLAFKETTNTEDSKKNPDVTLCDPGIQRTQTACDDIFVFTPLILSDSFTVDNREYTLEIVGFLQPQLGLNSPIRSFVTEEHKVTTADVYARIVSFCAQIDCGPRGKPRGAPECGCECALTDTDCQRLFGDSFLVTDDCQCICLANNTVCGANETVNPENCGCDCALNSTYCESINSLFGVTTDPDACECVCGKESVLKCSQLGGFWKPEGTKCECVCAVSDDACVAEFGEGYTANFDDCVCETSSGGGISTAAIAGAVVGSVAGAALLTLLVLGLAALLVYLIKSGHMPGIYGYRVEPADMSMAQNSGMFRDKWTVTGNQVA